MKFKKKGRMIIAILNGRGVGAIDVNVINITAIQWLMSLRNTYNFSEVGNKSMEILNQLMNNRT